jgi:hypothetical protein
MQKNYYAIIPANVRYDKELPSSAKLLYGELTALSNEKGFCWATNEYFAELYGVHNKSISRLISQLEKKGYVKISHDDEIVQKLKDKNLKGYGIGNEICSWCQINTSVLHGHHYPIPKSKGGTEIIDICPNCHHEFHYHEKRIELILDKEILDEINELRGGIIGKSI